MSVRHWWLGVSVLAAAIAIHALLPRYDWRQMPDNPRILIRVDRWTGHVTYGQVDWHAGTWVPMQP